MLVWQLLESTSSYHGLVLFPVAQCWGWKYQQPRFAMDVLVSHVALGTLQIGTSGVLDRWRIAALSCLRHCLCHSRKHMFFPWSCICRFLGDHNEFFQCFSLHWFVDQYPVSFKQNAILNRELISIWPVGLKVFVLFSARFWPALKNLYP